MKTIEKSLILLSQNREKKLFDKVPKIISHLGCSSLTILLYNLTQNEFTKFCSDFWGDGGI